MKGGAVLLSRIESGDRPLADDRCLYHSTVTLFARFLGLSTSVPLASAA